VLCGRRLEVLEGVRAPALSAERTTDALPRSHLMLNPSLHALRMKVTTATELAKSKVLIFIHHFITYAAILVVVKWPLLSS